VKARAFDYFAFEYEGARTRQYLAIGRRRRLLTRIGQIANKQATHVSRRPHGGGPREHLQQIGLLQHFRLHYADVSIPAGMVIMW
jgi:hypothetical protein